MEKLKYDDAVILMSSVILESEQFRGKLDAFDVSTILAVLFQKSKEETLADVMERRELRAELMRRFQQA